MTRRRTVLAAGMALVGLGGAGALAACSGGGGDGDGAAGTTTSAAAMDTTASTLAPAGGITEDRAIEIAREAVAAEEPGFDFDATFPVVREHGETYEISFPNRSPGAVGGEPHVVVDRVSGEVVDDWWTL